MVHDTFISQNDDSLLIGIVRWGSHPNFRPFGEMHADVYTTTIMIGEKTVGLVIVEL